MQGSVAVPGTVNLRLGATPRRRNVRRARTSSRRSSSSRGSSYYANRAALRRAYIRGKYPSSQYARAYIPRGQGHLGLTAGMYNSQVGPQEQAFRKQIGWRGRGDYTSGRGAYFGQVAGAYLGNAAATALSSTAAFSSGGVLSAAAPFLHAGLSDLGSRVGDKLENYVTERTSVCRSFVLTDASQAC